MLYPAVARWNSKCFGKIEPRRIQFTTTNIIATAIELRKAQVPAFLLNLLHRIIKSILYRGGIGFEQEKEGY